MSDKYIVWMMCMLAFGICILMFGLFGIGYEETGEKVCKVCVDGDEQRFCECDEVLVANLKDPLFWFPSLFLIAGFFVLLLRE